MTTVNEFKELQDRIDDLQRRFQAVTECQAQATERLTKLIDDTVALINLDRASVDTVCQRLTRENKDLRAAVASLTARLNLKRFEEDRAAEHALADLQKAQFGFLTCGNCGKPMTQQNATKAPELFLCDACSARIQEGHP